MSLSINEFLQKLGLLDHNNIPIQRGNSSVPKFGPRFIKAANNPLTTSSKDVNAAMRADIDAAKAAATKAAAKAARVVLVSISVTEEISFVKKRAAAISAEEEIKEQFKFQRYGDDKSYVSPRNRPCEHTFTCHLGRNCCNSNCCVSHSK
jgi:hypothetical protein